MYYLILMVHTAMGTFATQFGPFKTEKTCLQANVDVATKLDNWKTNYALICVAGASNGLGKIQNGNIR